MSSTAGSEPPTPRLSRRNTRSNYDQIAKVLVGPNEEAFSFHEDMVRGRSPFFKSALSREWNKNQEKIVLLPTQDPDTFHMYLGCVYSTGAVDFIALSEFPRESLDLSHGGRHIKDAVSGGLATLALYRLCKLWELASYLDDVVVRDGVIDALIMLTSTTNVALGYDSIFRISNNNPDDSTIYRWLTDYLAALLDLDSLDVLIAKGMSREFAYRLIGAFIKQRGTRGYPNVPQLVMRLKYHENLPALRPPVDCTEVDEDDKSRPSKF